MWGVDMNLKNQGPVLVPAEYRAEIEKLSKAALMDLAWDLATRCHGDEGDPQGVMIELRRTAEIVVTHRAQVKATPHPADCDCWRCDRKRRGAK